MTQKVVFMESGSGFGGSARCLHLLLKHISHHEILPSVLYSRLGPSIEAIKELKIPTRKHSLLRLIISIARVDLVYVNNEIYSHFVNILLAKFFYKKCICHMRGIRCLTRGEKLLAKCVDKFIAVSHVCRDHLLKEGIAAEKVEMIYDGVEWKNSLPEEAARRDVIVGTASRIVAGKGHATLLKAAEILLKKRQGLCFLVFGEDTDKEKKTKTKLEILAVEKKMEGRFVFAGWESDGDALYKSFDIAVCPSELQESLGMNVVEAMMFKKPVVASRIGAYAELIQDNVNGLLFEPGSAEDLARKIELLLDDASLRARLTAEGLKTAREKFDIRESAAKIESLIKRVCK